MRIFKLVALIVLMIIAAQSKAFAEMPEVSANEMYFDVFKGGYVLKGNVRVAMNNHGFKANIAADEAFVSVTKQKCWADGHVKMIRDDVTFSCDHAYIQWQTTTVTVKGSVKFANKKSVAINSDTAVFNWQDKVVDFYGKVTLQAGTNPKLGDGVKLNGKDYRHVKYNVVEDKILASDKTFTVPDITIPAQE